MLKENNTPLVISGEPLTPLTPSEPVRVWAEIDSRGYITGYSSSEITYNSVVLNLSELPNDFDTHYSFYRIDRDLSIVRDDTRVNELIKEQEEYEKIPTDKEQIELLNKEISNLKGKLRDSVARNEMVESAILELYDMALLAE